MPTRWRRRAGTGAQGSVPAADELFERIGRPNFTLGTTWSGRATSGRWLGAYRSDAPYQGVILDRGFVAGIRTGPDMFADMGDKLLRMAPIEHLALTANGPFVDALTSPTLGRMRSLQFNVLGFGDDEAIALAERGHFDRCDLLDLSSNRIGSRGVAALLANPVIRNIPVVCLYANPGDPHVEVTQDLDGGLIDWGLPPAGVEAEERYGRITWLHVPPVGVTAPDPYHVRSFRRHRPGPGC
jgi:hypothetical protein